MLQSLTHERKFGATVYLRACGFGQHIHVSELHDNKDHPTYLPLAPPTFGLASLSSLSERSAKYLHREILMHGTSLMAHCRMLL